MPRSPLYLLYDPSDGLGGPWNTISDLLATETSKITRERDLTLNGSGVQWTGKTGVVLDGASSPQGEPVQDLIQ
jgi:hypothetical protein